MGNLWKVSLLLVAIAVCWIWSSDHFDPKTLAGKRVLITGASSGIGEHLAYEYSKLGARVVIAARRVDRLQKVAQKCLKLGAQQMDVVVSDLTKVEDRDRLVLEVEDRFGGLDVLILNHGISYFGWWLGRNHTDMVPRFMEVNFVSHVDIAAKVLPMLTLSSGSIGVVSSGSSKIPIPAAALYSSTKAALQAFFDSVRQEFSFRNVGVSVTLAIIGFVDTDIVPRTELEKQKFEKATGRLFAFFTETPENTAVAILRAVTTKQSEIYFGKFQYYMTVFNAVWPRFADVMWRQFSDAVPS